MNSATKGLGFPVNWTAMVMTVLGFWLSASCLLDLVIMPIFLATGMMTETGFMSTGYVLFSVFNRLELVCAAIVLTAFAVFKVQHQFGDRRALNAMVIASLLFNIALIYTYLITPQMSGLVLDMQSGTMPLGMIEWQGLYWVLEVVKFGLGATLLRWCYQKSGF